MNAVKIKEILTWKVTSQPSRETLVISPFPFYTRFSLSSSSLVYFHFTCYIGGCEWSLRVKKLLLVIREHFIVNIIHDNFFSLV